MRVPPCIGLLALQGDYPSHERVLDKRGITHVRVTRPEHLESLSAVILPGGESSVMLKLLTEEGLLEPLRARITGGLPTLATCAGMILLARKVISSEQASLELLDISVCRNGYGRQIHSGVHKVNGVNGFPDSEGVFIRAPRVEDPGSSIEVLGTYQGDPVLLRQDRILAAAFHPELSENHPIIDLFLHSVEPGLAGDPRQR
jgi:pyridoxal 5'-phosphate synthase pdxT subunit